MTPTLEELKEQLAEWTEWRRNIVQREAQKMAEARLAMEDANHVYDQHATALYRLIAKLEPDTKVERDRKPAKRQKPVTQLCIEDGFTEDEVRMYNQLAGKAS